MRKCIYLFLVGFACVTINKKSFAQTTTADSSHQKSLNNTVSLFYAALGKESPLFNGQEYVPNAPGIKGNANFMEVTDFTPGAIYYDGLLFTGVPMIYDIRNDEVIILLHNHFSKLILLNERVKYFDFLNHHFLNLKTDSVNSGNSGITSGYFDVLYEGKSEVLVKREKEIQSAGA
jgi:hypothetical protein